MLRCLKCVYIWLISVVICVVLDRLVCSVIELCLCLVIVWVVVCVVLVEWL